MSRSFPRIGCAKRGSSADFCNEAVSFVWQGTKSLYRHRKKTREWRSAYCRLLGRFSRRRGRCGTSCLSRILRHVGCCQCVSNCYSLQYY